MGLTFQSNMCPVTSNWLQNVIVINRCVDQLTIFLIKLSSITYCINSPKYGKKFYTYKIYFHGSKTMFWLQILEMFASVSRLFC